MARRLTIVSTNGNRPFNEMWQVHADGCRDVSRMVRQYLFETYSLPAENGEAAADWWMDDDLLEMGYTHDDIRVMPCAK